MLEKDTMQAAEAGPMQQRLAACGLQSDPQSVYMQPCLNIDCLGTRSLKVRTVGTGISLLLWVLVYHCCSEFHKVCALQWQLCLRSSPVATAMCKYDYHWLPSSFASICILPATCCRLLLPSTEALSSGKYLKQKQSKRGVKCTICLLYAM